MGTRPTPAIDKNGIAWLAGEASGDYIASLVLPEVEKRFPGHAAVRRGRSAHARCEFSCLARYS